MSDDVESALLGELRALAGPSATGTTFTIRRGNVPIEVTYSGGSSSSITLRAPYGLSSYRPSTAAKGYRTWARPPRAPRPLQIKLTQETEWNVRNKSRGIDREVQTWDPDFDREVYIDTMAPDEAVAYVLSLPTARNAARVLMFQERFGAITIDDARGDVETSLGTFTEIPPRVGRGLRIADTFAALVESLPAVEAHGSKPFDAGRAVIIALAMAAAGTFLAQFFGSFVQAPAGCIFHDEPGETSLQCVEVDGQNCCTPIGMGFGAGLVLGLFLGFLASRPFRGTSRSSWRRVTAWALVAGITVNLSVIAAEVWMW